MRLTSINPASLTPHPLSDEIFGQMGDDQLEDLKKDIAERGLQNPLELDSQQRVICGSQRLRAIKALGLLTVEVIIRDELVTEENIRVHVIKDNTLRRQLNPGQMYRAGIELERIYRVQAEKRQLAGLRQGAVKPERSPLGSNDPNGEHGGVAEKVAKEVGTSREGYKRLKKVMESGEQDLIDKVEKGQMAISAAVQQVKARKPAFKAQALTRDDPRSQLMAVTKFRQDVERFSRWVEARPPSTFGVYASDAAKVLQELVQVVSGLSQYAPARSG